MPLRRIVVIANPNSRAVSPPALEDAVRLLAASVDTRLVWTEAPGRATGLAGEHGADPDTLVAVCGGDGTIHEVLNGLPPQGVMGIIPAGTANVVARELGMPLDLCEAAKTLLTGALRRLDTGRLDCRTDGNDRGEAGRRFLMVAGCEFDAHVASSVPRLPKRLLGQLAYHLESLRRYPWYVCPRIRVEIDGGDSVEGVFALFANLRRYGGGLFFAADARSDDGLLNLVLFRGLSPGYLMRGLWEAWTRRGVGPRVAHRRTGRVFRVRTGRPVAWQLDGEVLPPCGEATISVEPRSLTVVAP